MKQLGYRAIMVLCFILMLAGGILINETFLHILHCLHDRKVKGGLKILPYKKTRCTKQRVF